MAKQLSHIKISGSIDDLTYFSTKNGYKLRKKKALTREQLLTGDAFERTRENNTEFTRAAHAGKLLREALNDQLKLVKGSRIGIRLFTEMMRILRTDPVNNRGQRLVQNGNFGELAGFEFNEGAAFKDSFSAQVASATDRVQGTLATGIAPFVPTQKLSGLPGATHCKLFTAAVELNFPEKKYRFSLSETAALPISHDELVLPELKNQLTPNSTLPWLLVIGIVYLQDANGKLYPFKDKSSNTMKIVLAEKP